MLQRRSVRQMGARLALLAVWLQLALTLGHIHPWDIYRYGHPIARGVGAADLLADRPTTPMPLSPLSSDAAADLACSICANMALAGSVALPDPDRLSLPPLSPSRWLDPVVSFSLTPAEFLLFQTRAPPLV